MNDVIIDVLSKKTEEMILRARNEERDLLGDSLGADAVDVDQTGPTRLPLIRLRVEYSGFDTINATRFGKAFVGRVANPGDILLFYRKKTTSLFGSRLALRSAVETELLARATRIPDPMDQSNMEELISSYLGQEILAPHVLVDRDFQDALRKFVEKEETDAFAQLLTGSMKGMEKYLAETKDADSRQLAVSGTEDSKVVLDLMAEHTRQLTNDRAEQQRIKAEAASSSSLLELDEDAMQVEEARLRPGSDFFKTPTKPAKATGATAKPAGKGRGKTVGASQSAPNSIVQSRTRSRFESDDLLETGDQQNNNRAPPLMLEENDYVDDDLEAQNLMITPKKSTPTKQSPATKKAAPKVKSEATARPTSPKKTAAVGKKRKAAEMESEDGVEPATPPPKRAKQTAASPSSSKAKSPGGAAKAIDLTEDDDPPAAPTSDKKSLVSSWARKK